jgi:hypothetical protein
MSVVARHVGSVHVLAHWPHTFAGGKCVAKLLPDALAFYLDDVIHLKHARHRPSKNIFSEQKMIFSFFFSRL